MIRNILIAAIAAVAVVSAQDQRPPVFRGGANFVYVDVYPRRDGRLVENLRAEDFQVFEDGKPQRVETFEFIRFAPNTPEGERRDPTSAQEGERLAADPRNRVFVIYLDLYHTVFGSHEARRPIVDFLNRAIGPSDLFAAMTLVADVNLAPLAAGDYAIELVAGRGEVTETMYVAFRLRR